MEARMEGDHWVHSVTRFPSMHQGLCSTIMANDKTAVELSKPTALETQGRCSCQLVQDALVHRSCSSEHLQADNALHTCNFCVEPEARIRVEESTAARVQKNMNYTSASIGAERNRQHHFVLVHGACHGAWNWSKLKRLLENGGHRVTTVDLAGAGESPLQADDLVSFDEYNAPLVDLFMNKISPTEKVILVAHSMGGLSVSAISERYPEKICVAVYVVALMLNNISFSDSEYQDPSVWENINMTLHFKNGPDSPPTSMSLTEDSLRSCFYQLSSSEDQDYAIAHIRPGPTFLPRTKISLTQENYGTVPRVFIHVENDLTIGQTYARAMVAGNVPKEELSIPGDHMVMLSRPKELQEKLEYIANKYHTT